MGRVNLVETYTIEALSRAHDRKAFGCGVDALDRYLHRQASQDMRRNFAAVLVAVHAASRAIHGFYTLSTASVRLDRLPVELAKRMPRYPDLPAVRLGRLAVHLDARGRGLGTHLVLDAMVRCLGSEIAWAAFLVDAKDEGARDFYLGLGFLPFDDNAQHLFLVRTTIERLLDS